MVDLWQEFFKLKFLWYFDILTGIFKMVAPIILLKEDKLSKFVSNDC